MKLKVFSHTFEKCFKHNLYPCNKKCKEYGITDTIRIDWLQKTGYEIRCDDNGYWIENFPVVVSLKSVRQAIDYGIKLEKKINKTIKNIKG